VPRLGDPEKITISRPTFIKIIPSKKPGNVNLAKLTINLLFGIWCTISWKFVIENQVVPNLRNIPDVLIACDKTKNRPITLLQRVWFHPILNQRLTIPTCHNYFSKEYWVGPICLLLVELSHLKIIQKTTIYYTHPPTHLDSQPASQPAILHINYYQAKRSYINCY